MANRALNGLFYFDGDFGWGDGGSFGGTAICDADRFFEGFDAGCFSPVFCFRLLSHQSHPRGSKEKRRGREDGDSGKGFKAKKRGNDLTRS